MGGAGLLLGAVVAMAVIGAATAQVIAAPSAGDQPLDADTAGLAGDLLLGFLALALLTLIAWRRWNRLPARPRTPLPLPPLFAVGLFFVAIMLGQAGAIFALRAAGVEDAGAAADMTLDLQARVVLAGYAAEAVVLIAIAARLHRVRRSRAAPPLGPVRAIGVGLAALLLVWPMTAAAGLLVRYVGGLPTEPIAHETLRLLVDSPRDTWFVVVVATATVAAPLAEELIYRGLLQPAFRVLGGSTWLGIVITSLVFAVMHIGAASPHALASLFVLSLGFGWAYEKTGRLLVPLGMHVAFNAGNIALALAMTV